MKKHGLLNSEISKVVDDLRHADQIIIADCGLPIPNGVKEIDISLVLGTPDFISVLEVILSEVVIEELVLADEILEYNYELYQKIKDLIKVPTSFVSHRKFKEKSHHVKAIIRTGEASPYANIILQSAVCF